MTAPDNPIVTEDFRPFPTATQPAIESALAADEARRRGDPPAMLPGVAERIAEGKAKAAGPGGRTVMKSRPAQAQAPQSSVFKGQTQVKSPVVAQQAPAQVPAAPVANPQPVYSAGVSEGEAISVALPSRFAFYDFKDLYVKPLRLSQMAKISKAHEEQSLLPLVEAVSACLSTPQGHQGLGFKLCVNDFYFVLYWLHLNSFTKRSISHKTYCMNPKHIEAVRLQQAPEDSLAIHALVTQTDLEVTELEVLPDPQKFVLLDPQWYLRPATMLDTVAFMEHPDWMDAEFQYMAKLASNISMYVAEDQPEPTLEQKIEAINNWAPSQSKLIQEYETLLSSFGVKESVNVKCKWCGASRDSEIILDAHSFLLAD